MRLLVVAALTIGCARGPTRCVPSAKSQVELRDAQGALLLLAQREPSGALALCDAAMTRTGELRWDGPSLRLTDRAGAPRLVLAPTAGGDFEGRSATAQRLRVHREPNETFVVRSDGVRFGSFVAAPPNVRIYDKQSVPVGTVEPRGPDQTVRTVDGDVRFLVQPASSGTAAGVFALAGLEREEQMALYVWLSR
jgi:hypothetical protein